MTFTIGCDPEIFVKKNGKNIGVYETGLPGDKVTPHKTSHGAVQQDGMAAEFNTNPVPLEDFDAFNDNIVRTIGSLRTLLNASGEKVSLSIVPVAEFPEEYMKAAPEKSKELGCDPDFFAYTMAPNPRPEGTVNFRTGAGHIHVGWGADIPVDNEDHMNICAGFIKALDMTVGMFMTVIDTDPRRRILYGKAGAFRPKSYGVEYRTPSNMWIKKRETRECVHALVNKAIFYHSRGYTPDRFLTSIRNNGVMTQEEIQRIIDEGDVNEAVRVLDFILSGDRRWLKNRDDFIKMGSVPVAA